MSDTNKIIISPGQGLLLLIEHYTHDKVFVEDLKKIYLRGPSSNKEKKKIESLLKDNIPKPFEVSFDADVINQDPSRRYFETHLAYESLKYNLSKLSVNELENHYNALRAMASPAVLAASEPILNGEKKPGDNKLTTQYADTIDKITSGKMYNNLSQEQRDKILLLVKCQWMGLILCLNNNEIMPLNIYGQGVYNKDFRGVVSLEDQNTTRNQNFGLLKGHMPVALDDIARSENEIPYLKSSDQSTFEPNASWVESNFNRMVHPFSNSISGTLLTQLRSHAYLKDNNMNIFTHSGKKMEDYNQLFISSMLYNSGGHSLNELVAPLSIRAVKEEFKDTPDFETSLENMFLTNNLPAFDQALEDTRKYNKMLLLKGQLHQELTELTNRFDQGNEDDDPNSIKNFSPN